MNCSNWDSPVPRLTRGGPARRRRLIPLTRRAQLDGAAVDNDRRRLAWGRAGAVPPSTSSMVRSHNVDRRPMTAAATVDYVGAGAGGEVRRSSLACDGEHQPDVCIAESDRAAGSLGGLAFKQIHTAGIESSRGPPRPARRNRPWGIGCRHVGDRLPRCSSVLIDWGCSLIGLRRTLMCR